MIWNAVVILAMVLLYLAPVVAIYFVVRACQQVRSHHQRVERELLLMNQQLGRLLQDADQPAPGT